MREDHQIGAYEAKTKLPELLRKVVAGERFTITQRGQPVAHLIPADAAERGDTATAARRMRAFVDRHRSTHPIEIKGLIEEGRD
jgi:prevent-host-death family protein